MDPPEKERRHPPQAAPESFPADVPAAHPSLAVRLAAGVPALRRDAKLATSLTKS